tara:strand:+ start:91 stop:768 length:678 start_codon:yes stop_codon:yes gene_type:complete
MAGKSGTGKHPIRYTNPITGVTSSQSWYIDEQGIKKILCSKKYMEYKVNGEWVKPNLVPHLREWQTKYINSKKGYMLKILAGMTQKGKERIKQGKYLQGENEFRDDRWGRCDKLMEAYDKQVEQYGNKCPMTHIPFTMHVPNQLLDINNYSNGFYSNISADRIFNPIDYTEQNTIFTSQLWNLSKGERSISELELIFKPEIMERYKALVEERFPDQKYILNGEFE